MLIKRIKAELFFQLPIIALAFVYLMAALAVAFLLEQDVGDGLNSIIQTMGDKFQFMVILVLLFAVLRPAFSGQGDKRGLRAVAGSLADALSPVNILVRLIPVTASLFAMNVAFTLFKKNITTFMPFSWDRAFADMDEILFLGNALGVKPCIVSRRLCDIRNWNNLCPLVFRHVRRLGA